MQYPVVPGMDMKTESGKYGDGYNIDEIDSMVNTLVSKDDEHANVNDANAESHDDYLLIRVYGMNMKTESGKYGDGYNIDEIDSMVNALLSKDDEHTNVNDANDTTASLKMRS
jgi:NADH/NAD ratio-sensing transcriptional regulator Rex